MNDNRRSGSNIRRKSRTTYINLLRLIHWVAVGGWSGGMVGGAFLSLLDANFFWHGFYIGLPFGCLGGFFMGELEWNGAPPGSRHRAAVGVGVTIGLFLFLIGAIPGAMAAYISACVMEVLWPSM